MNWWFIIIKLDNDNLDNMKMVKQAVYPNWLKLLWTNFEYETYIDGLVQERHNSIANALELRLSCTNPSIWTCQKCGLFYFPSFFPI